jgi:hypothetical protein
MGMSKPTLVRSITTAVQNQFTLGLSQHKRCTNAWHRAMPSPTHDGSTVPLEHQTDAGDDGESRKKSI